MPKVVYKIPAQEIEVEVDPEQVQQWHGMGPDQRNAAVDELWWEASDRLQWTYELRR